MSIESSNNIDLATLDDSSNIYLVISDHLKWSKPHFNHHVELLQDKINAYLEYVESDQIFENYPQARGKGVAIILAMKHKPTAKAFEVFDTLEKSLNPSGVKFDFYFDEDKDFTDFYSLFKNP